MRRARDSDRQSSAAAIGAVAVAPPAPRPGARFAWCWIAGISLLIVQRPLDAPDLWWHLARGRAVLDGTVAPSRQLLTLDTAAEADWLGGVPFYALWQTGGVHALAAVPVAAAGIGLLLLFRLARNAERALLVLYGPLVLWIVRSDLQPVGELWDLAGMTCLWLVLRSGRSARWRMLLVAATFAVWSNLGPRPVWGLLVLMLFRSSAVFDWKLLPAAVLGGLLNPRGAFAWRDSLILLAPSAFAELGDAAEPGWYGLWQHPDGNNSAAAFAVLWLLSAIPDLSARISAARLVRWGIPLLAAIACRANLPACGLWLLLDRLQADRAQSGIASSPPSLFRGWSLVAGLLVVVLALADAAGAGLAPRSRLGWGIAHAIDPRLLDIEPLLSDQEHPRIGWSPDSRSTGIAAWLGAARMCDHPQRALLGGRRPLHLDLIDDFSTARRARYRRDDGTWGGRLHRLADWDVQLLFVPMEDGRLHRALRETSWQPADLDSPTVPYVPAGDLSHAQLVVDVLRQQGLVEIGPWQPTSDIYDRAGWRYDVPELLGRGPSPFPALRQSRFFRGLGMPMAALRSLLPVRQVGSHRELMEEFAACQSALAWQEYETFGNVSRFRNLVLRRLSTVGDVTLAMPLESETVPEVSDEAVWRPTIDDYIAGRVREALDQLPPDDAQAGYAAALLSLELGDTDGAQRFFAGIRSGPRDSVPVIGAVYWLGRIQSFDTPGVAGPNPDEDPL